MKYRIKEVEEYGKTYYYPQYKSFLFWRSFVWWGGESGSIPYTIFHTNMKEAILEIEKDKRLRKKKALKVTIKPIYHYIND